jgi:hypothetical protein
MRTHYTHTHRERERGGRENVIEREREGEKETTSERRESPCVWSS